MTIQGFDVDSLNKPISFGTAFGQGYRACYIKLGGNNLSGNDPYLMTSNGGYHGQTGLAHAAGFQHRGGYWATGGYDPARAARYYLANLDPATTFDVLDNEVLNAGRIWTPPEAEAYFQILYNAGRRDLWMYASRLGAWAAGDYNNLVQYGVKALVADYSTPALGSKIFTINYPNRLIRGHQHTSSASIGGTTLVDADAFTDDAFDPAAPPIPPLSGENMFLVHSVDNPDQYVLVSVDGGQIRARYLEDPYERAIFLAMTPALPVTLCDGPTFAGFLSRVGYVYGAPIPPLQVTADVSIDDAAAQKIGAQIHPVSADEIASATRALIQPDLQAIQVPKSGTITLS